MSAVVLSCSSGVAAAAAAAAVVAGVAVCVAVCLGFMDGGVVVEGAAVAAIIAGVGVSSFTGVAGVAVVIIAGVGARLSFFGGVLLSESSLSNVSSFDGSGKGVGVAAEVAGTRVDTLAMGSSVSSVSLFGVGGEVVGTVEAALALDERSRATG